eukprot:4889999-Karenia_brevis.AAC.1
MEAQVAREEVQALQHSKADASDVEILRQQVFQLQMQLAGKAEAKDLQKTRQQCEALSQGEIPDTVKEEFAKMNA